MGSLIKPKHNTLFHKKTLQLLTDLGDTFTIYLEQTKTDCSWCILDTVTDRSSGLPESGKDWSTHPNYQNDLLCPNCSGDGYVTTWNTVTVTVSHIEDISGERYIKGKAAYFPAGTKRITGIISDVEVGGRNYLRDAKKIVIDSEDYKLFSYEKLGILDDYLFRAIVERVGVTT